MSSYGVPTFNGIYWLPPAGINPAIAPGDPPNGVTLVLPVQTQQVPFTQVPNTNTSQSPNFQTAIPTPINVQNDPNASTVLTSASSLLGTVAAIVTNPAQHIIGVIVLLAIGWFLWKHR